MKVKVLQPFFDINGLHQKGEIVETKWYDEKLMEKAKEDKKDAPAKSKNRAKDKQ